MPSRNVCFLMGHLGGDADVHFTPGGVSKTSFSLATTRKWKDGEEWKEATDWHRVVAWRLNDKLIPMLLKGHLVDVEGRIETRKYEKDGREHFITEIVAHRVNYLRAPFRNGPRDADAPPARAGDEMPPDNTDVPF